MIKFIMLVGLPASGKTTKAKEISEKENALILSSDALRLELYGSENHQDNNSELFNELYRRARETLKSGQSVIIDATNINSKRRISTITEFKNYQKEVYYFNTDIKICLLQDKKRDRSVGIQVIDRMYKTLQIPTYAEGWNEIHFVHNSNENRLFSQKSYREYCEDAIGNGCNHEYLFDNAFHNVEPFLSIKDLPQDSSYHSLSVSRHTYYVWLYILENYNHDDKLVMLWAALLHDTGKAYCKNFKEGSRYANFIGHENVSGQLSAHFLNCLGYDDDFILKVVEIVQLHMRLLSVGESESGLKKLREFVGEDVFYKLQVLKNADEQAK